MCLPNGCQAAVRGVSKCGLRLDKCAKRNSQIWRRKTFCRKYARGGRLRQHVAGQWVAPMGCRRSFPLVAKRILSAGQTNTFARQKWHFRSAKRPLLRPQSITFALPPCRRRLAGVAFRPIKGDVCPQCFSVSRFFADIFFASNLLIPGHKLQIVSCPQCRPSRARIVGLPPPQAEQDPAASPRQQWQTRPKCTIFAKHAQ